MELQTQVNLLWIMTCTALVFFMPPDSPAWKRDPYGPRTMSM